MKHNILIALIAFPFLLAAQADTVIVELAKTSKLMFTMQDSSDLGLLREYDYDALFEDILHQLEMVNPSPQVSAGADITITPDEDIEDDDDAGEEDHENWSDDDDDDWEREDDDWEGEGDHYPCARTNFVVFDLGINNLLQPGNIDNDEDPIYSVRPWGSWYVGINTVEQLRLSNQFSLDFRAGLSVYNFKFEEDNVLLTKTPTGTIFSHDPRQLDFTKSKLTESHVNIGIMAVFNSRNYDHSHSQWHWHRSGFRVGIGPYVGYRLDSYNKLQFEEEEDGDRENERNRSNFHLNNLRYGIRLQLGIRNADFFFQYDLNELFKDDKGPRLNAYSFGMSF